MGHAGWAWRKEAPYHTHLRVRERSLQVCVSAKARVAAAFTCQGIFQDFPTVVTLKAR